MATFNVTGLSGFKKGNKILKKSIFAYRAEDYNESYQLFQQAMANGANKQLLLIQMASAINRQLKWKEAAEAYKYIYSLPKAKNDVKKVCLFNEALCLWKLGKTETAIKQIKQVLENDDFRKWVSVNDYTPLAFILMKEKRYDEALEALDSALELVPTNSIALAYKGQMSYLNGNRSEAKDYLLSSLESKSTVEANYFLGLISLEEQNTEAAREYFEDALDGSFSPLSDITEKKVRKELDKL